MVPPEIRAGMGILKEDRHPLTFSGYYIHIDGQNY